MKPTIYLNDPTKVEALEAQIAAITLRWGPTEPQPVTDADWRRMDRARAQTDSPTPDLLARKAWMESVGHSPAAIWDSLEH